MPNMPRRRRARTLALVAALAAAAGLAACGDAEPSEPEEGTVVVFAFTGWPEDTMRVLVRTETTVTAARDFIAGRSHANIPIGPIVRGSGVDARWPYHYVPEEVQLAEVAIELCDGAPMRTPAAVDEFFLGSTGDPAATRATWCPWGAYPVAVEE
ncbi:MAG TPA: hypothetical protein VMK65_11605 [Longimicrobiales bacterium]|nr:hypothetical protein [Longimicrobiales bacterium]